MSEKRRITLLAPGVLEAGLMSIVSCPVCARNLGRAFNRSATLLFLDDPWEPEHCPDHDRRVDA